MKIQSFKEKANKFFIALAAIIGFQTLLFNNNEALAAWKKAGITPQGDIENSTIYDDLDKIIYFIMAIGGFWVIGSLVFAGMKLAGAQGRPQARTEGFIGLAMAALGLFVIVKAYDIAGWIAGLGE